MDKSNYKHHRNPEVSIILPTYNRGNLLERALESIRYQAFKDFEVVLINDGGSDISPIIKKFPDLKITYIQHEKNLGLSEARNSGLKIAKGKYITYLDDDDEYYPNHLESLINYLDRSPDVKVAYSIAMYKYQQKSIKGRQKSNKITARFFKFDEQQILINNLSPITCFCHLKECVKVVGGFNPSLKRYEDWEFWIRLSRVYKFKQIQEVTCQINKLEDGESMMASTAEPFSYAYIKFIYQFVNFANIKTIKKIESNIETNLMILYEGLYRGLIFNSTRIIERIFCSSDEDFLLNDINRLRNIYGKIFRNKYKYLFLKIIMLLYAYKGNKIDYAKCEKALLSDSLYIPPYINCEFYLNRINNSPLGKVINVLETIFPAESLREKMLSHLIDFIDMPLKIIRKISSLKEIRLIKESGYFDESFYIKNNPDLQIKKSNSLNHYLNKGWREGKDPSEKFDTSYYLEKNPDVKYLNINPLIHYLRYGQYEGRMMKAVD